MLTQAEWAAANNMILVDHNEAQRPAASRDARNDLRVVTIDGSYDQPTCVVCLEDLLIGSKAKKVQTNRKFCNLGWFSKVFVLFVSLHIIFYFSKFL
jgi:hypothetical protein